MESLKQEEKSAFAEGATQTKHHRTRTFDLYNLRLCAAAEESATGVYGMPALPPAPADAEPEKLVPFNVAMRLNRVPARRGVHFFIDDYQFDRVWNAPERYVAALRRFDCVFTPDFSLYLDMPRAMKIWNIYRARLIGRYWSEHGVRVVPALSWAEPETFDFCFEGLPTRSTLAVARVGVEANPFFRYIWEAGFAEAMRRLEPRTLMLYSNSEYTPSALPAGTRLLRFSSDRLAALRAGGRRRLSAPAPLP